MLWWMVTSGTIVRPSYFYNGKSYAGKSTYLCSNRALGTNKQGIDEIIPEYHKISMGMVNDF